MYRVGILSTELEFFLQSWNTFVQSWNAFYRVGIPLYIVGMLSTGLECFLQSWNAFYKVELLSTGLEYICI
jgi:ABC-type spermidine/putrescine transport system permease subunit II